MNDSPKDLKADSDQSRWKWIGSPFVIGALFLIVGLGGFVLFLEKSSDSFREKIVGAQVYQSWKLKNDIGNILKVKTKPENLTDEEWAATASIRQVVARSRAEAGISMDYFSVFVFEFYWEKLASVFSGE